MEIPRTLAGKTIASKRSFCNEWKRSLVRRRLLRLLSKDLSSKLWNYSYIFARQHNRNTHETDRACTLARLSQHTTKPGDNHKTRMSLNDVTGIS